MSFLGFGRKDNKSDEELTTIEVSEVEGDEIENEDFAPFVCRKCGQMVTSPFETCEVTKA